MESIEDDILNEKLLFDIPDPVKSIEFSICLNNIEATNNCITKCGHTFCFTCIITCLCNKNTCPYCREELIDKNILNPCSAIISQHMQSRNCVIKLDGKVFNLDPIRCFIRNQIRLYLNTLPNKDLKKYRNCTLKMFVKIPIKNSVTNRNYEFIDMKIIYHIFFKYSTNVYSFARSYETNGTKIGEKVENKLIQPRFRF
jgi:hypothetical protein